MRESQKAESQSCRLPKARTPRESKQNRSSRIRSTRWSVRAAGYPLPDLPPALLSLRLFLSLPIYLFPPSNGLAFSSTRVCLSNAPESVADKAEKDPNTLRRLSKIDISCNYSHGARGKFTVASPSSSSSSSSSLLSRGRKSEADSHCRVTTMLLRNGKTFAERKKERKRGRETIFAVCEAHFKIPTV